MFRPTFAGLVLITLFTHHLYAQHRDSPTNMQTLPTLSQEEEPSGFHFEAVLDFYTCDIWNGMVGYDHPIFQPTFATFYDTVEYGEFLLGVAPLYQIGTPRDKRNGGLSELDVLAAWNCDVGPFNCELGYTYYWYPSAQDDAMHEGYVTVKYDNPIIVPSLTTFYDFNQTESTYFQGALCRDFKITEALTFTTELFVGAGTSPFNRTYFDVEREFLMTEATAKFSAQYDITESIFIGAAIAYTTFIDRSIHDSAFANEEYATLNTVWGSVSTGVRF